MCGGKEVGFLLVEGGKPSETTLRCVVWHRAGEGLVLERSVASSRRPAHAGLVAP